MQDYQADGHAHADAYAERLNRKGREGRKGTPVDEEEIGALVVDSAMKVHSALGPGLLESAYRACLAYELEMRGLDVSQGKPLPIRYEGAEISVGYRIDLLLNQKVIVELKAVERLLPIHTAQALSYLHAQRLQTGVPDQLQRPASKRWDQTRCQWTLKFSFASFASFAVQDWVVINNNAPLNE